MLHPCRTALRVLTLLVLVPLAFATAARGLGWEAGPLAWVVAMTPWIGAGCVVALVLALVSRSLLLSLAAAVLVVVQVAWQLPLFVAADRDSPVATTVMTFNLRNGGADPATVVDLVREHDVQVLALEELTSDALRALQHAGLDEVLPYDFTRPADGFTGTGIWSRTPLRNPRELRGFVSHQLLADSALAGRHVTLAAVHPVAPQALDPGQWRAEYVRLQAALTRIDGALVVAGDFNATRDQATFRSLLGTGLVDAADQSGAGLELTFPHGRQVPPLVAIDHVLVRDDRLTAVALLVQPVPGSDHLAVMAGYALT